MKRGDFITVAMQGDFGKPRPALVIQSNLFSDRGTVTILPVTSDLKDAPGVRVTVMPNPDNGLKKPSQVMVDKAGTTLRSKCGPVFGRINPAVLREVDRCLAVFLGIAK
ncbi:MAG: type II toxin-antitoxin system PemK/MazF family toxin [Rhodocyclaceae bacterium]|nr:type II toxin-antitoxin system PemK/MazF family toxin [Rhodocyclaceae bacterium]